MLLLSSAIIEDVEIMCKPGFTSMAYFAFDFKDNHKQTRLDMISSLLTQLAARSDRCCDILSRLYSTHNRGAQMATGTVLAESLKDMISLLAKLGQGHVYIIIDAIDEPREEVLELLEQLVKLNLSNFRLCVTSRHEVDIQAVLEPLSTFSVSLHDESGQKQDILDYIRDVVHTDQNMRRWRAEDKSLVINTLSERANGMSGSCCVPRYTTHVIYHIGSDGCPVSWIF
jgi:hypothetical protein